MAYVRLYANPIVVANTLRDTYLRYGNAFFNNLVTSYYILSTFRLGKQISYLEKSNRNPKCSTN
jgi:hypothetical protein